MTSSKPDSAQNDLSQSHSGGLVRGLTLRSATAIVISDTIGTGIFLVTSDMARAVGSVELVFAAWITAGIIVFCGAFCYAELGAAFPKAGGSYVYLNEGLGPLWGYLFGWMSSVLERPVGIATLAAGFLRFAAFLFPVISTPLFTTHIGSYAFNFTVAQPLAALVVVAVTAVNYLSVKFGGGIQVFLTILKTGTILLIVIGGMFYSRYSPNDFPTSIIVVPTGFGVIGAVLTAMVPAMWAYNGFNDLGDLGEEIEQPGRNIPRAIVFGFLTVGTLYLLANVVYFRVMSFTSVAQSMHVASDVVQRLAGPHGAAALTAAMAISALGALHVVILTGARIPFAMARDGVFFRFAERVHPKFRTPSGSLLFLGGIGAALALTGTYEELYSLFVFAVWIFFALNAFAMLRLRWKQPNLNRPYRAFGYPVPTIIFLVTAIALTVNLWLVRPVRSTLGLLVIAAGIPLFYRWRKAAPSN